MISTVELESRIQNRELCVNCGACEGMCPYWHSFRGRMTHDYECSREEGRCVAFCPRMPTDIKALRDRFFESASVLTGIGPFRGLYIARAADTAVRERSQHGGAVTALAELALKEGFIDAAVMTRSKGGLSPEGFLAASAEEIRSCRGSSFQIPAALSVLNAALKEDRYKKLGVIGTPCKTLAVYKMMAKPIPERDNNADNIGLVIGLFCGWGLDWNGLERLIAKHADPSGVGHIDIPPSKYHCMALEGTGGKTEIDLDEVVPLVRKSCRLCTDMTAEFSDISVGGARSGDGWEVDKGWNQIIVRTEKGAALLEAARLSGVLEFKEVPEANLEKLIKASLGKKRTGIANITALTGDPQDLGYLNPSAELFREFIG
jgi:coenzyme F420 hydrogenase subunit beta